MRARSGSAGRWLAVAALLVVSGCAQPSGSSPSGGGDKVPDFIPTDRWFASERHLSGGAAAADRNAAVILGCEKAGEPITLLVSLQQKLPIDYARRPVTIIFDGSVTHIQNWGSLDTGYATDSNDPGFRTIIEDLQKYRDVEFVLGRPGKDIDTRRFNLAGAKEAIDTILSVCGRPW